VEVDVPPVARPSPGARPWRAIVCSTPETGYIAEAETPEHMLGFRPSVDRYQQVGVAVSADLVHVIEVSSDRCASDEHARDPRSLEGAGHLGGHAVDHQPGGRRRDCSSRVVLHSEKRIAKTDAAKNSDGWRSPPSCDLDLAPRSTGDLETA
jgi:hypothetical protein